MSELNQIEISEMTRADFEAFWPTFESVIKEQKTYAFDPDMSIDESYKIWCDMPLKTFVAKEGGRVLGTYYIKANAAGPSNHICNCGYMVSSAARGKGIATSLCEHSQKQGVKLGFTAMQFNSVISTNSGAVRLWQKLGYSIIGTIPSAFRHPTEGLVDAFIMHKKLVD